MRAGGRGEAFLFTGYVVSRRGPGPVQKIEGKKGMKRVDGR